jgi:hypothetical protein
MAFHVFVIFCPLVIAPCFLSNMHRHLLVCSNYHFINCLFAW